MIIEFFFYKSRRRNKIKWVLFRGSFIFLLGFVRECYFINGRVYSFILVNIVVFVSFEWLGRGVLLVGGIW